MLKPGIIRFSEWATERKAYPERTGRLHTHCVLSHQADTGGHKACPFEEVAERTHGARAIGSDRGQEYGVDLVLFEETGNLRCTLLKGTRIQACAHKTVVNICQGSDPASALKVMSPFSRAVQQAPWKGSADPSSRPEERPST